MATQISDPMSIQKALQALPTNVLKLVDELAEKTWRLEKWQIDFQIKRIARQNKVSGLYVEKVLIWFENREHPEKVVLFYNQKRKSEGWADCFDFRVGEAMLPKGSIPFGMITPEGVAIIPPNTINNEQFGNLKWCITEALLATGNLEIAKLDLYRDNNFFVKI